MPSRTSLAASHLRCEFLVNPLGINERVPRLSWIVSSERRGDGQTAYRILVASTLDNVVKGAGDLWDTGEVKSDETVGIEYRGKPLSAGQRAWWSVQVKDKNGEPSNWAEPAFWENGLDAGDWKASWIGRASPARRVIDAVGAKWIWYPEGNPAVDAPFGDRFFRKVLSFPVLPDRVRLWLAADKSFRLSINGREIGMRRGSSFCAEFDITAELVAGDNVIDIIGHNVCGPAGVLVFGEIEQGGMKRTLGSDRTWDASIDRQTWKSAIELCEVGEGPFPRPMLDHGPESALYASKSVDIPANRVVRARAYVSAKGLYRLSIDGRRVGDDIFTPGWTDYRKRIQYETYDVTPALQPGKHEVEIVVGDGWYCGLVGIAGRENYGPKPMALCQIAVDYEDGSQNLIVTDGSWHVGEGPILANDLLLGENFDARRSPADYDSQDIDVQPIGEVPLVGRHSPPVRQLAELKPEKVTEPNPGVYVFDLGQNMVGWARLRVAGPAGKKVTLRHAEMLDAEGMIYTDNLRSALSTDSYICGGKGEEVYEPSFTFHGFRYVEVTGYPGSPGTDAITGIVIGSDTPQTGTFECSNPMVNQLWRNIFWGQRGNYLEVPTDCPQRDERLGWMGDAQIFARSATFNNDIAAFMTKWMQDVVDAQSPEGGFSDVSPRVEDLADGAPAWADAGVVVPWTMYLAYADRRLLERHYDSMKAWIDSVDSANPDHIWINRANANFGDWLNVRDDTPREVLATACYARCTGLFARIAKILGRTEDAAKYANLREEIVLAFNGCFVAEDGTIKGDTQTIYVLALNFDLLPPEKRPFAESRLVDHIMTGRQGHLSTGFVGVGFLCPTLTSIGRSDVAYRLLENDSYPSWGYSIRHGATTIWERWDGWTEEQGFQDPDMNSFNHYALGSVGEWMMTTVAGIDLDPAQPGYKHVVIRPVPGGSLTYAGATYDSIRGRIVSDWKLEDGRFEMTVEIPANTTATVHVPTSDPASVRIDGEPAPGAVFDLPSGRYPITAKA